LHSGRLGDRFERAFNVLKGQNLRDWM